MQSPIIGWQIETQITQNSSSKQPLSPDIGSLDSTVKLLNIVMEMLNSWCLPVMKGKKKDLLLETRSNSLKRSSSKD